MKMKIIIFILAFACFTSSVTEKLGIDLELGEGKVFQIRSLDEEPITFSIINHFNGIHLQKKYFDLIKDTLKKNILIALENMLMDQIKVYLNILTAKKKAMLIFQK